MRFKRSCWYCSHTPHVFCFSKDCLINRKPTWQHYYRRAYWQWYEIVRLHNWNLLLTTILFRMDCLFSPIIGVSHITLIYHFTPTKMHTHTQTVREKTVAVLKSFQSVLHRITHNHLNRCRPSQDNVIIVDEKTTSNLNEISTC